MSEMNASIQQFLHSNTDHNFPLVKDSYFSTNHPAEHGINLDVMVAAQLHPKPDLRPFFPFEKCEVVFSQPSKRSEKVSEPEGVSNCYFGRIARRIPANLSEVVARESGMELAVVF